MNLATESSAPSAAERRESVSEFQSLIVWEKKTALVNVSIIKKAFEMPKSDAF